MHALRAIDGAPAHARSSDAMFQSAETTRRSFVKSKVHGSSWLGLWGRVIDVV